jgi:hypothetical protein
MIVLVIVLVALVPLVVWAAMVDLKRRQLRADPINVETRAAALKASVEAKAAQAQGGCT